MSGEEVMDDFSHYGVMDYLRDCYDVLHTQGNQWLLAEIDDFIDNRKKEEQK